MSSSCLIRVSLLQVALDDGDEDEEDAGPTKKKKATGDAKPKVSQVFI